jgi:hypothetical protein
MGLWANFCISLWNFIDTPAHARDITGLQHKYDLARLETERRYQHDLRELHLRSNLTTERNIQQIKSWSKVLNVLLDEVEQIDKRITSSKLKSPFSQHLAFELYKKSIPQLARSLGMPQSEVAQVQRELEAHVFVPPISQASTAKAAHPFTEVSQMSVERDEPEDGEFGEFLDAEVDHLAHLTASLQKIQKLWNGAHWDPKFPQVDALMRTAFNDTFKSIEQKQNERLAKQLGITLYELVRVDKEHGHRTTYKCLQDSSQSIPKRLPPPSHSIDPMSDYQTITVKHSPPDIWVWNGFSYAWNVFINRQLEQGWEFMKLTHLPNNSQICEVLFRRPKQE